MNSKLVAQQSIVVVLIMLFCMAPIVSARNWQNSNGYRYDNNCDFNGHDISCMNGLGLGECAQRCISHGDCTHFTQREDNFCCIKKNQSGFLENHAPGHRCGFIPGRSDQPARVAK